LPPKTSEATMIWPLRSPGSRGDAQARIAGAPRFAVRWLSAPTQADKRLQVAGVGRGAFPHLQSRTHRTITGFLGQESRPGEPPPRATAMPAHSMDKTRCANGHQQRRHVLFKRRSNCRDRLDVARREFANGGKYLHRSANRADGRHRHGMGYCRASKENTVEFSTGDPAVFAAKGAVSPARQCDGRVCRQRRPESIDCRYRRNPNSLRIPQSPTCLTSRCVAPPRTPWPNRNKR